MIKTLKKSDWVVIGLSLMALYFVYSNVVQPMLFTESYVEAATEPAIDMGMNISEESKNQNGVKIADKFTKRIDMKALAISRQPSRDPFLFVENAEKIIHQEVSSTKRAGRIKPVKIRIPRLYAVVSMPGRSYAVLDGKIKEVGEQFGVFKITEITRSQVALLGPLGVVRLEVSAVNNK